MALNREDSELEITDDFGINYFKNINEDDERLEQSEEEDRYEEDKY